MEGFLDKRAKQVLAFLGLIILLIGFIKFAQSFSDVLIIIGTSILISYLLIGPVDLLTKVVKFRWLAVMLVYLSLITLIILTIIFVFPKLTRELSSFSKQIPNMMISIEEFILKIQLYLRQNNIPINLTTMAKSISGTFENITIGDIGNIALAAIGTVHTLFYTLVTGVLSYYFLLDGRNVAKYLTKYIPNKYKNDMQDLLTEMDKCLRGFYVGTVKLAAINATVMFITYIFIKVPYALLLAIWHFIGCIIPTVGGWVGIIPAVIVIAFTNPMLIWVPLVVYEGFTRLIKDNFITPRVMGDAIGIHPIVVLIAVLVGFKAGGLIGVLFAIPIFGVVNVILKHFLENVSPAKKAKT
ncbi:MAG: AI-2E family transporter [Candidatus Melainabacteria bacterium]|nr:AI-2E family transporter [Candidatus Melainabacteria bacterium]MBI3308035.1 AI-2E family transporter [Candidatus Melainabacteria bacterium]